MKLAKKPSSSTRTILKIVLVSGAILIAYCSRLYLAQMQSQATTVVTRIPGSAHDPQIWERYTTDADRAAALQRVLPYIKELVDTTVQSDPKKNIWKTRLYESAVACNTTTFGSGYGAHDLCDFSLAPADDPCLFISFGISDDYSFDTDMANRMKCRGFAADPTVIHPSSLHELVTFHNLGATMLKQEPGVTEKWVSISLPTLVNDVLRVKRVNALKMDCEGCEYALARDVVREDPQFFDKIDQLTIEIHVSKRWIDDEEAVYHLGLLYELLNKAGLEMQNLRTTGCSYLDEIGCHPELEALGFPCGHNELYGGSLGGYSCHNALFARRRN